MQDKISYEEVKTVLKNHGGLLDTLSMSEIQTIVSKPYGPTQMIGLNTDRFKDAKI